MVEKRKYLASFFTSKQTIVDYYREGDNYYLRDGILIVPLGLKERNIEDIKLEISQRFDIPLGGLKQITKKETLT